MTEKEFEQLKVGDKVWIYHGFLSEAFVVSKQDNCVEFKADSLAPTKFDYKFVGITKSQALEGEIELQEKYVELAKTELGQRQATLSALKAELAKAKEGEGKEKNRWFVDFNDGVVREQANGRIPPRVEPHLCGLYSTETDAYAELAKYYYEKANEAVAKRTDLVAKERGWKK